MVRADDGHELEVQIRTFKMHYMAEYGAWGGAFGWGGGRTGSGRNDWGGGGRVGGKRQARREGCEGGKEGWLWEMWQAAVHGSGCVLGVACKRAAASHPASPPPALTCLPAPARFSLTPAGDSTAHWLYKEGPGAAKPGVSSVAKEASWAKFKVSQHVNDNKLRPSGSPPRDCVASCSFDSDGAEVDSPHAKVCVCV